MIYKAMIYKPTLSLTITALLLVSAPSFAQVVEPDHVRIGVFTLFHPQHLVVLPNDGSALMLHAGTERIILEKSSGIDRADVRISGGDVIVRAGQHIVRTSELEGEGLDGQRTSFILAVPGKLSRVYRGTLNIEVTRGTLRAIVDMDTETAVASVVSAETLPGTPMEALKAQAVAARSYLVAARGRHRDFDFCDTTHCQFLREAPGPQIPATLAASLTRGLVLENSSQPVAAMYTRSCSGRTQTPSKVGLSTAGYPYYPVECKYCREHPSRWRSDIDSDQAASLKPLNESSRLAIDRQLEWNRVPSNDFTMKKEGELIALEGVGEGHGIGLCQAGSKAMAQEGADYRTILAHYYPNTLIVDMGSVVISIH